MMWGGKQYDHCPYSNVRYAQTAGGRDLDGGSVFNSTNWDSNSPLELSTA
jgi:hypothetical protein